MSVRHLIPLLGAELAVLASASPAGAVVGGTAVGDISDIPYQAAVINGAYSSTYDGQVCGAVILGPRQLATAAHCVFDAPDYSVPGQAARPDAVDILAGTSTLGDGSGRRVAVSAVS